MKTVEQLIKELNKNDFIKIFNHLTGIQYFYGFIYDFIKFDNTENYLSLKDNTIATIYNYNDVVYIGVN